MKVEFIDGKLKILAHEEDLCFNCGNTEVCPLMGALCNEIAVLRYEEVEVSICAMHVIEEMIDSDDEEESNYSDEVEDDV